MTRIALTGGTLYDGTGAAPRPGALVIEDGRIAAAGDFEVPPDARQINCTGLAVAPGFIDAHSHSDLQVLENRREKLLQGVTTEVVGNCGFSVFPAGSDRQALHNFANGILCGEGDWGWSSASSYLRTLQERARLATVHTLVGHGTLCFAVEAQEKALDACLAEGACGLSTGLMYAPGANVPFEELVRLCRIVARHGKILATHMRSYSQGLLPAVDEQLELARRTGCRLQISHLQAVGPRNWHLQATALERIERAREQGLDVAFDCYPYTRGSTVLTQLLPQEALEGGIGRLLQRLAQPSERRRIAAETLAGMAHGWDDLFVAAVATEANQSLVGMSLEAVAGVWQCDPIDAVFDLLIQEHGRVNILEINQSEANLRQLIAHPLAAIVSDGFYVHGRPHPRLHGAFAHLLGTVCRDWGWLTLAQGVHKVTGLPANRFGIAGRGELRAGFHADVTVFDPLTVGSPATYDEPCLPPSGIRHVFRNGVELL